MKNITIIQNFWLILKKITKTVTLMYYENELQTKIYRLSNLHDQHFVMLICDEVQRKLLSEGDRTLNLAEYLVPYLQDEYCTLIFLSISTNQIRWIDSYSKCQ